MSRRSFRAISSWSSSVRFRGSEQDGRRPALVVSVENVQRLTRRAIVCPITSNVEPWPTKVLLPPGLPVHGAVLTDQIRSIDREEHIIRHIGAVPKTVLEDAMHQVCVLLGFRDD